jgi:hypothetical protein
MRGITLAMALVLSVADAAVPTTSFLGTWESYDRFAEAESPVVLTLETFTAPQCKSAEYSIYSDGFEKSHWYFEVPVRVLVLKIKSAACTAARYDYVELTIPVQLSDQGKMVVSIDPEMRDGKLKFGGSSVFFKVPEPRASPNKSLERTRKR